jgi:hypothetical protein
MESRFVVLLYIKKKSFKVLTPHLHTCMMKLPQAGWAIAAMLWYGRGKSVLRRARRRGNPGTERSVGWATETGSRASGHGEKVVQETTGVHSNVGGQATPVGSKVKQRQWSGPLLSSQFWDGKSRVDCIDR